MSENKKIYKKCQSCGMPIKKDENKGTEKDGSLSNKYCNLCYKKGKFIDKDYTLEQWQEKCDKAFKKEHSIMHMFFGKSYLKSIPKLERWKK